MYASQRGFVEVVRALLRGGADVHVFGNDKRRALHYAGQYNRVDVAQLLLLAGASKDDRDNDGRTPMQLARRSGHSELADGLLLTETPRVLKDLLTREQMNKKKDAGLGKGLPPIPGLNAFESPARAEL